MKRRSIGFQLTEGELPHPLEEEDLETLVEHWREGDKVARDDIIKYNLRLAVAMAASMASRAWHIKDDLLSVSLLTLCQAVDKFPQVASDNRIIPYVAQAIKYALVKELADAPVIRIPDRTIAKCNQNGTELDLNIRKTIQLEGDKKVQKATNGSRINHVEFNEIMELCAETDEERLIFQMVLAGHHDIEIARILGRGNTYVWSRRNLLFNRFRCYWSV
jgi:DNA-directed RNA polymerase specialized sigma subunit